MPDEVLLYNSFCHFVYLNTSHTDSEPGEVAEEEDEDDGDEDQRRLLLPPTDVQLTATHGGHSHPRRPSTNDVHNILGPQYPLPSSTSGSGLPVLNACSFPC